MLNYLFEKIISFKNEEAKPDDYFCIGEFDLIINNIKGEDILNSLSKKQIQFLSLSRKKYSK